MKIEKVNDHQIRCTLTKEDLADREIKLSELAYGTDKAKDLFRDMMQQASFQYGFEAEDIPLMIEAIPLNAECIVLVITKVDDPEELDTRFSKFAPSVHEDDEADDENYDDVADLTNDTVSEASSVSEAADSVLDLFKRISEAHSNSSASGTAASLTDSKEDIEAKAPVTSSTGNQLVRMYLFNDIATIIKLAHVLNGSYQGNNTLYKNASSGIYSLIMGKGKHTPEEYNRICNILSEYGTPKNYTRAQEAFLSEHCEEIINAHALQSLGQI